MALTRIVNAGKIINQAATEIGLAPVSDPLASQDDSFIQLVALLNICGDELASAYQWEFLTKSHQVITADTDSGDYPLPDDFLFMINQTGWEHTNRIRLFGPLSAQDWAYLNGRKLASHTIYASFRLREGLFSIFPQPPPNGLDINFEYQSKNWAVSVQNGDEPIDELSASSDLVLFDRTLVSRYLKVKFLEAKGLDSSKAQDDFATQLAFITNVEKSAEIISAGRSRRGAPYLDAYRNLPDTNYGF